MSFSFRASATRTAPPALRRWAKRLAATRGSTAPSGQSFAPPARGRRWRGASGVGPSGQSFAPPARGRRWRGASGVGPSGQSFAPPARGRRWRGASGVGPVVNHSLRRHGAGGGGVRAVLALVVNHSLRRHGAGGGGVRAVLALVVNHSLRRHGAGGGVSMERKPDNSIFSSIPVFRSPPPAPLPKGQGGNIKTAR